MAPAEFCWSSVTSYGPARQAQCRSPRAGCRDRQFASRTVLRKAPARPFDIVFLTRHTAGHPTVSAQIEQLVVNAWVDRGSLIVVERSRRTRSCLARCRCKALESGLR